MRHPRLFPTILALILSPGAWAGSLVWSALPSLPSPRAECAGIEAPGGAVLLLGGVSPGGATVVPALATAAGAWSTAPSLDTTRRFPGAAVAGSHGIVVVGGRIGTQSTDEVLLYDVIGGDSQDAQQMATPRQQCGCVADAAGRVYAIGGLGASGQSLATVERYDAVADTWSAAAALPAPRHGLCAVVTADGSIYAAGGASSTTVQGNVYRYSVTANTWTQVAALPVPVKNAGAAFAEGRLYVVGGVGATGAVSTVQVYDVAAGTWTQDTPLPAARHSLAVVARSSGELLAAGGYDAAGAASTAVWQTQRLDIPEAAPEFTSTPVTTGSLDRFYTYTAAASGNPLPTFALAVAPAGMTIDSDTGDIVWQPIAGQLGPQNVTVRASNRAGARDQSFTVNVVADTIAPTAPTQVEVGVITANSVELAWSGATDAVGVHHYAVYRQYRCGFHGIQRCYALVQGNLTGSPAVITGLSSLTSYTFVIRAFDAAGHESPSSKLFTFRTLSPPVSFRWAGATTLPANFPLQLQLYANANPQATFALVSGPAGLSVDPESGLVSWQPTAADVGSHALVVRAENTGGSVEMTIPLTVRPDAPQLSVQPIAGAGGARDALAGALWEARVVDTSHTPSTFALVSGPTGLLLDPATGLLSWQPTPDDAGDQSVVVRATNAASSADIVMRFYSHFTSEVTALQVTGLTDLAPVATWTAPATWGADRVVGYAVTASARYRSGRTWRTHTLHYETEVPSAELTGLVSGRTYRVSVQALDEFAHRSLPGADVTFVPRPGVPAVGWTVTGPGGGTFVAGNESVVQLLVLNLEFGAVTFGVVSAPAGFVLDSANGLARWTPGAADVGTATVVLRATNAVGPRDVTLSLPVVFAGAVQNLAATADNGAASVSWQPPVQPVVPVDRYRVVMHWQIGSRRYSRAMETAGLSLDFGLVPTGAVWHIGVTVTALDATGRAGLTSALVPYNNQAPTGLPPAETAWIEQITLPATGAPLLDLRGEDGATSDLEVSTDMETWDWVETITLGPDGSAQCPDPQGQSTARGFYRVRPR